MKCPKCQTENPDTQKFCGECGTNIPSAGEAHPSITKTIETPREELTTGSTFAGRYQIIEELGKGGMGKVYKVLDKETKEKIALKLIKPEIASDKNTIERFRNELTTARKISHRNVCRMFDLNREQNHYFITMEYVSGGDLKRLIRRTKRLDAGTAIAITKQICDGLSEAHELGIVHRDLKPNNIMIDDEGNAKIMDFGIARSIRGKGITGSGIMIGTPEYMSPEQVEAKEIDQRSDIYSLGVVMYEMLTGRLPFEADTPFAVGVMHKSEIPKDPKEYNSQVPDDLGLLVLKCLEKDKDKRPQSAGEIRAELSNIEKGIPTTDKIIPKRKPITSKEITVSFSVRRLLIPVLVVIVAGIIGLFLWHPWSRTTSPIGQTVKPSLGILPFEDISPQKDQEHLCIGIVDSVISALSNVDDLRIPARGSLSIYKKRERTYAEIAELLDVRYILDGTLQKPGDTLRITPRLIDSSDDSVIWSDQYDMSNQDILSIQDEMTKAIVEELKVNLLAEERDEIYKRGTENVEAYNHYLLGQHHLAKRKVNDYFKSYDNFNKAIELDPNYVLAYVGLANTYILHSIADGLTETRSKAEEAIAKALEIDENLAEAHTTLAWIKFEYHWDWEGAEREFKRAIDLNPNYATAHQWYAEFLNNMGRYNEARQEIELALELSPLSLVVNAIVGFIDVYGRRYDEAITQYKKTIELDSNFIMTYAFLSDAYRYNGQYQEGLEALEEWRETGKIKESGFNYKKMMFYAHMGQLEETIKFYEQIKSDINNYYTALMFFEIGDNDQGFEYFEKAYEERYAGMRFIKVEPELDHIRSDQRYKEILRKMNLD
ncbi:protein kinase [Acidobacteriota bacterium]